MAKFNVGESRTKFMQVLADYGRHEFINDQSFVPHGRQRRRCSVCQMSEPSAIHYFPSATKIKTNEHHTNKHHPNQDGFTREKREALTQALATHGIHLFAHGRSGRCKTCHLSRRSMIHRISLTSKANTTPPVVVPTTIPVCLNTDVTSQFNRAISSLSANPSKSKKAQTSSNELTIACPWCDGTGSVHIPRDVLLKMLTQEQH